VTAARDDAIRRLHNGVDPFAGFDPAGWANPADKWDSHHPWFDETIRELRPRVIVEVGSFLGASSRHFANALAQGGLDGVVVCVDTWLAEEVLWGVAEWRAALRFEHGRPQVYNVWLANALASGLQDYLCPLSMDSTNGARYLASKGMSADMVYIDGCHMEGDVYRDLAIYWERVLRPGGVMLIDDYQHTPDFAGVVHDVDRFAAGVHQRPEIRGTKARLRKPMEAR